MSTDIYERYLKFAEKAEESFPRRLKKFEDAYQTESEKLRHYVIKERCFSEVSSEEESYYLINTNGTKIFTSRETIEDLFECLDFKLRTGFDGVHRTKTTDCIISLVKSLPSSEIELVGYFDGNLTIKNLERLFPEFMI